MGLFSRSNSRSNSHSGSQETISPPRPGLDPLPVNQRSDGRGHTMSSTTKHYDIGLCGDWNYPNRRSMEDTSVAIIDYLKIPGCAFFAVFDGHAGAQCAQIAATYLPTIVANTLDAQGAAKDVALALSQSFQQLDEQLRTMEVRNSGSTAVVAITCYMTSDDRMVPASTADAVRRLFVANVGDSRAVLGAALSSSSGGSGHRENTESANTAANTESDEDSCSGKTVRDVNQVGHIEARRLTYDHRCSDVNEQRRVTNAGGLVVNNRVNGMLAVTRSLGDLFMKDYVVGAPYTTETELENRGHEFLVLACDGLYDVCDDEMVTQIVDAAIKRGENASKASKDLLEQALQAFSMDNITVMVVRFLV